MSWIDLVFGKPLASGEERGEQVGPGAGISIFGLDALSSAAYGPEAALTLLIPLGLLGAAYLVPITVSIIILLLIVYFSYRQTIHAYPTGGGSYTVARHNLGPLPALLAAAALMTDYVLTAAVGISAGVGALVSAVPSLQPRTLALCLAILVAITIVNLRGGFPRSSATHAAVEFEGRPPGLSSARAEPPPRHPARFQKSADVFGRRIQRAP